MHYQETLTKYFRERKRQNAKYSLRAYARDLGLHPSTLSKVLKGDRGLPFSQLQSVTARLKLKQSEVGQFFTSALHSRGLQGLTHAKWSHSLSRSLKNDLHFKIIAEWEHLAFLNLIRTKSFKNDSNWICSRLGITGGRFAIVVQNLLSLGFIEIDSDNKLKRCDPKLKTTDEVSSMALKIRHQNDLKDNMNRIKQVPIEYRDVCSMLFAANIKNLKKAKQLTRNYLKQMEALLEKGERTEVYQLSVQLMPLTKI